MPTPNTSDAKDASETKSHPSTTSPSKHNLQLEYLFRAAFDRTKSRFLSYFLSVLMFFAIGLGAGLVILIVIALNFLIYGVTKSPTVTGTVAFISSVLAITGLMYLRAWSTLTTTLTLISGKPISVTDAMNEVKPFIWRYVGFSVLMLVFVLGLIPFGIFTLFILIIVWGIWGSFSVFVFLDEKKPGLQSLWTSRAIVNQRFWAVLGRFVLIYAAFYAIMGALTALGENYRGIQLVSLLISLFIGPYLISYMYEVYKNLPRPEKVQRPTVWIVISVIGGLIMLFGIISAIGSAAQNAPDIMKNVEKQMMLKKTKTI